jgi:hypothetical protein
MNSLCTEIAHAAQHSVHWGRTGKSIVSAERDRPTAVAISRSRGGLARPAVSTDIGHSRSPLVVVQSSLSDISAQNAVEPSIRYYQ